jgi:hypothetical protein
MKCGACRVGEFILVNECNRCGARKAALPPVRSETVLAAARAESTDAEEIERLREIVKRIRAEALELRRMLYELRETATRHKHG